MPSMRPTNDPILAIAVSDVHLSLRAPIARAEEENWLEAQARPWYELTALSGEYDAPIIVAGDLFDRWNPPSELVNWALDTLPKRVIGIPGNHDLPSHRHAGEHRSAWGTLVRSGKVHELQPDRPHDPDDGCEIYGFPFGGEVAPPKFTKWKPRIAVIHEFMWTDTSNGFHGAPEACRLTKDDARFAGYDIVVVGDNHIGFEKKLKCGATVVNCGTLLRRKSNEADYQPRAALLHKSGAVTYYYFETDQDVLTVVAEDDDGFEHHAAQIGEFIDELSRLERAPNLSFRDTVIAYLDRKGVAPMVRESILEALDE